VAGKFEIVTAENVTACDAGKFRTDTLPVTAPKVVDCDTGKLRTDTDPVTLGVPEIEIEPTHTLVPLTALVMSVIACVPRLTTVWAGICCPLERMVESVVAD
jgi:hypothetical protein